MTDKQSRPPIPVTEPHFPPLEDYVQLLREVWSERRLTNHGPCVQRLESQLAQRFDVPRVLLVANGALGLHLATRALGVRGEIITTPFSYVATTSCPLWDGNTVVFADIEPDTLTIDPAAVAAAVSPRTEAIMATHVYGNPCDLDGLAEVARRHSLAVIYDAAHAFGVTYQGRSVLAWGDLSMVSLHATKLFHTAEGGLIAGPNEAAMQKVEWMRRFGHNGEERFHGVATNAKLSELHAAIGLCQLPFLDRVIEHRRRICQFYDERLPAVLGLQRPRIRPGTDYNWAYYPVLFASEAELLAARQRLIDDQIEARRYFYPALDAADLAPDVPASCPVAADAARRVLCLPLSATLSMADAERVVDALVGPAPVRSRPASRTAAQ